MKYSLYVRNGSDSYFFWVILTYIDIDGREYWSGCDYDGYCEGFYTADSYIFEMMDREYNSLVKYDLILSHNIDMSCGIIKKFMEENFPEECI